LESICYEKELFIIHFAKKAWDCGVSEKIPVQNLGLLAVKNHHLESDTQLKSAKGRNKRKQQAERREEAKIINKCLYKCLYVFFSLPSLSPSFLPSSLLSSSPSLFLREEQKFSQVLT